MRLDIVVRNSQDNQPIPGAAISVYYQHVNGLKTVATNVTVGVNGTASVEVPQTGNYTVELWAEGFIPSTVTNYTMSCSSPVCDHVKLVSMSPTLAPGQTRIMMTWEKERPADVDIHVMSVRRSDNQTCRTFYGYKTGCPEISLDLDNTRGGLNGAETMTLLDNNVNKDYVYVIGVEDYGFENNGTYFLDSGCEIRITNGIKTEEKKMVASSVTKSKE